MNSEKSAPLGAGSHYMIDLHDQVLALVREGQTWERTAPKRQIQGNLQRAVTQARFTKDGLNGMIAAPEDRAEIIGRLIAEVGPDSGRTQLQGGT